MTRYANMDALRRSLSPDVRVIDDGSTSRPAPYRLTEVRTPPAAAASEHDEQAALFAWAAANEGAHPELALMFAVPNGGQRHPAVAAQLKAEGVKAGVPDIFLPCKRGKWGGLFIEMKRRPNRPTQAQDEWIARLRAAGYLVTVEYSAEDAISTIEHYMAVHP